MNNAVLKLYTMYNLELINNILLDMYNGEIKPISNKCYLLEEKTNLEPYSKYDYIKYFSEGVMSTNTNNNKIYLNKEDLNVLLEDSLILNEFSKNISKLHTDFYYDFDKTYLKADDLSIKLINILLRSKYGFLDYTYKRYKNYAVVWFCEFDYILFKTDMDYKAKQNLIGLCEDKNLNFKIYYMDGYYFYNMYNDFNTVINTINKLKQGGHK